MHTSRRNCRSKTLSIHPTRTEWVRAAWWFGPTTRVLSSTLTDVRAVLFIFAQSAMCHPSRSGQLQESLGACREGAGEAGPSTGEDMPSRPGELHIAKCAGVCMLVCTFARGARDLVFDRRFGITATLCRPWICLCNSRGDFVNQFSVFCRVKVPESA